jgi:hypothetical protein
MNAKPLPSLERVTELLTYDPETGHFYWKKTVNNNGGKEGDRAGSPLNGRYRSISIDKSHYLEHRLAWLISFGEDPGKFDIDHIDEDKLNNKLSNLRLATRSSNKANTRKPRGYSYHKPSGRWMAYIKVNGVQIHLGRFDSQDEAKSTYEQAKKHYFGEFAPT